MGRVLLARFAHLLSFVATMALWIYAAPSFRASGYELLKVLAVVAWLPLGVLILSAWFRARGSAEENVVRRAWLGAGAWLWTAIVLMMYFFVVDISKSMTLRN